jgi:hypothetical protein
MALLVTITCLSCSDLGVLEAITDPQAVLWTDFVRSNLNASVRAKSRIQSAHEILTHINAGHGTLH